MNRPRRAIRVGSARARVAWALLVFASTVALSGVPARAQTVTVLVEQTLAGSGSGGMVSASLDPGRRYSLQVVSAPDGMSFHGLYSQNWFAREGGRRAGSSEATLAGRAPWEQELLPPAPALVQWTFAASVWNDGGGTVVIRLVEHGPR
jgi:hypothetical protein